MVKASGTVVATSREKMSKSKYNVVNPDDMCNQFGADALRLYELFMGPLEDGNDWDTSGVFGTRRFLDRAWRLAIDTETGALGGKLVKGTVDDAGLERALHGAIKKVTEAVGDMRFNTAVSEMMVFVNEATKAPALSQAWFESFVKILSPFAPHLAEEMWQRLGHRGSITYQPWPVFDEAKLARDTMMIGVQISGKLRSQIEVPVDATEATILETAKADAKVLPFLDGKPIKREIYVKGRLVNLVV